MQNVRDLVYLRSIDLAFTNVRVLKDLASGELGTDLKRQIVYVAPLTTEEAHILVQPEINSLEELRGKKVSFHIAGSSSALAGAYIFKALGIDVKVFNFPQPDAVEKMRQKELDATVCICPKIVPAYASIKPEFGFKFIEVPYPQALEAEFLPSRLTGEDYPNIIQKDKRVQTVGMNTILVTLNWPKGSMRYNRNAKFVEAFFCKFPDFLKPPRQVAWKTVNLAGTVPGWTRFTPAQEWLDRNREQTAANMRTRFDQFLSEQSKRETGPRTGSGCSANSRNGSARTEAQRDRRAARSARPSGLACARSRLSGSSASSAPSSRARSYQRLAAAGSGRRPPNDLTAGQLIGIERCRQGERPLRQACIRGTLIEQPRRLDVAGGHQLLAFLDEADRPQAVLRRQARLATFRDRSLDRCRCPGGTRASGPHHQRGFRLRQHRPV